MIDNDYTLANAIIGSRRAEDGVHRIESSTILGEAVEDSSEGMVRIVPYGDVFSPDGDNTVTIPTSPSVQAGDTVQVNLVGGVSKRPMVVAVKGEGDRLKSEIDTLFVDVEGIETLIREYSGGVLVAKVGNGMGALVNADGSFDVVSIAWSDGEPIVGDSVSSFGESVTIGKTGETHLEIDGNSMELFDLNSGSYFFVGDMRDASGKASFTDSSVVISLAGTPYLAATVRYPVSGTATVYIPRGVGQYDEYTGHTLSGYQDNVVVIDNLSQGIGTPCIVAYQTESEGMKVFTLGKRSGNDGVGAMSVAEGYGCGAQGDYSHAEGFVTHAYGQGSHAEGYGSTARGKYSHAGGEGAIANGYAQTAIGKYNVADTTSLLIVGNGTTEMTRSNALKLDASGNLTIAGELDGTVDWSNIVNAPSMQGGVLFGKVDATSTATAFTATVEGLDALVDGAAVYLTNGVVTSAADFTININGLGAKPVYTNLAAATEETTKFNINYSMLFIYNSQRVTGGCWDCYNGYDSNTNTIGYQLRTNNGTMVAADKGYRYRLWFTSTDGSKWVPANTSTSTNATANRTLNQRPIDPFGAIVYYSTNGTTNAGAALAATTQWQQYTLNIGYSYMQSGFSLTANEPVYIQCTPQSDGSAIMNSIVQALPTTDDGKIYIFLGIAYSATSMELRAEHPVYYFRDGAVRPWTNQLTTTMDAATNADVLAMFG